MSPTESDPQMIELRDFPHVLRRGGRWIILIAAAVVAIGLAPVLLRSPAYTARAQVEVRPLTVDEQLQPFASDSFVNMDTEAARVTQEPIAELAARALGLDPGSPADLAEAVKGLNVVVEPNTTYLDISCTESDAGDAQRCANAFATAYVEDRVSGARKLYEERTNGELAKINEATDQIAQLRSELTEPGASRADIRAEIRAQNELIAAARANFLSLPTASPNAAVFSRTADVPKEASNKSYVSIGALLALLGLALGVVFVLVRERLLEPVVDGDDLENVIGAPVLATVPEHTMGGDAHDTRLVTLDAPDSPPAQAYMAASAVLLHLGRDDPFKVVAVTQSGSGGGTTTTTANLALLLAQGGHRVVAVSCDLRNPRLHTLFDKDNEVGLTSLLADRARLDDALQATGTANLSLISSGPVPDNPAQLLRGGGMTDLMDELSTRFDFALMDTSPGSETADVLFLAPLVDGFILVADAFRTPRAQVRQLRSQLEGAGGRIIGGILSNAAPTPAWRGSRAPLIDRFRVRTRRGSEEKASPSSGRGSQRGRPRVRPLNASRRDGRASNATAPAAKAEERG
jgi:capsular exopolysaccharide synthesis family protein